jgi:endonuclease/exonuclease/phosphatase family metal-dependent hydrolase
MKNCRFHLALFLLACTFSGTGLIVYADSPDRTSANTVAFNMDAPREIETIPSECARKPLRVITWNIDHGRKLDTIIPHLVSEHADLYVLQEVDWNTRRAGQIDVSAELAKQLSLNVSYSIEFEELGQESRERESAFTGQATLTRLPVRGVRVLRFKNQCGYWRPRGWMPSSAPFLQRRLGGRVALVTELDFSGRLLVVYNVHLENLSLFGLIQFQQMDEILKDADQYTPGTAVIIAGDMNTKFFPSFFLDRLEKRGFHSSMAKRIPATELKIFSLDWIFVRGPVILDDGQVRKGFKGSDHVAVAATLTVQQDKLASIREQRE